MIDGRPTSESPTQPGEDGGNAENHVFSMTLEGLHALARERFGPNASDWKFVCPQCGHIAAVGDFPPEARQSAGQNCLGRYVEGVGCKHAAYGLITQAPWTIATADGDNMRFFALAEAEPADELMNQLS